MFDFSIHDALLFDGSGAPPRRLDLGVRGDRIAAIAPRLSRAASRRPLDGTDLALAPGFIDAHTHDDRLLLDPSALPAQRHPKLQQGVTTVVTGNCGISLAPLVLDGPAPAPLNLLGDGGFVYAEFADYLAALAAARPAVNAANLVGHSTLRAARMTRLDRAATDAEADAMAADLRRALAAGAWGLSTGLYYPTASAAPAEEVVRVGAPLAAAQGLLAMHLRDEGDRIDAALDEALAIAARLRVGLVISHHKLVGRANHGRSVQTLARIERAQALQPVCLDCYPYAATSTMLLPERVRSAQAVQVTWSAADPAASGRRLDELARERGQSLEDTARALQPAGAIYFALDEADVRRILAHPLTMIGSDGLAHDRQPHPRLWGSFPRVLGHYARDAGLMPLTTAVHKMTGLPARQLGLAERGALRVGACADLVLFDPARIADRATYEAPQQPPVGIEAVWVNGRQAVAGGQAIDLHAGIVLKKAGETRSAHPPAPPAAITPAPSVVP
ncbi:MAG: N-acyl-D-amino-acid deacylase family protein [Betaproteobacteria bacterium]